MGAKTTTKRTYPWKDRIGDVPYTFRLMTPDDGELLTEFTSNMSEDELLFLRMDITRPEVREIWLENVRRGRTTTLFALDEKGKIAGYSSLHRSDLLCTRHHGELRVFVHHSVRGNGLGQVLIAELYQVAQDLKLERVTMNIAREQQGLRQLLESMGFRVEALLTDWLKSRDGRLHDLVIMSYAVGED